MSDLRSWRMNAEIEAALESRAAPRADYVDPWPWLLDGDPAALLSDEEALDVGEDDDAPFEIRF